MIEILKIEKVEKTTDIDTLMAFIYVGGNDLKTDSRKVAVAFNKRHADVIRAVENLEISNDFRLRNFAQASFHGKALAQRKTTKRRNQAEIAEIQQQIQPDLFGFLDSEQE